MNDTTAREDFLQLVQQHKGIIIKICHSYCHNRSQHEDLAQEIIYQLWKSFRNYRPEYTFSTWMYRVALNVAISYYRKEEKALPVVSLDEEIDVADNNGTEQEENIRLLQVCIRGLKELDRALILLHLESKTYKEIAEILGITETNVATKLSRIREKLKQDFSNLSG